MKALRWSTSALAALTLIFPASALSVTFGANLDSRTPTSDTSCGYPPYYPGYFPLAASCTFFSTATPTGGAAETQVVPLPDPAVNGSQSGRITEVRLKTGAGLPGSARLTVLRAHRAVNGGEAACCVGQAESAQFTLTPNSIVHVSTDLPVASTYDAASRIYSYDILALSVLDSTTLIPAELSGNPSGYCSAGFFPHVQTGQERFTGEYGVCGYLVLMQADLTIDARREEKAGGNGGGDGGGGNAALGLVGKPKTLANGNVEMTLDVPAAGKLVANATATVPAGRRTRASRSTSIRVSKRTVPVAKAGRLRLVLRPNRAAKEVIERRGKLKAKATVVFTPGSGRSETLKRPVTFG